MGNRALRQHARRSWWVACRPASNAADCATDGSPADHQIARSTIVRRSRNRSATDWFSPVGAIGARRERRSRRPAPTVYINRPQWIREALERSDSRRPTRPGYRVASRGHLVEADRLRFGGVAGAEFIDRFRGGGKHRHRNGSGLLDRDVMGRARHARLGHDPPGQAPRTPGPRRRLPQASRGAAGPGSLPARRGRCRRDGAPPARPRGLRGRTRRDAPPGSPALLVRPPYSTSKSAKSNPGDTTHVTSDSTVAAAEAHCQVPAGITACGV